MAFLDDGIDDFSEPGQVVDADGEFVGQDEDYGWGGSTCEGGDLSDQMVLRLHLELAVLKNVLALLALALLGVLLAVLSHYFPDAIDELLGGVDGGLERRAIDLDLGRQLDEGICLVDLLLDDVGEEGSLERGKEQQRKEKDTGSHK